ncbi:MAG TPA: MFS transporter [Polyangiaceae bacterium]|nr:MFS transporter [Polyangiaceae bacterium]
MSSRPAPLASVLSVTFLGSVSGGAFWSATYFVTAAHYGFSAGKNLALAAVMGAVYAVVARAAGPILRRFGLVPRTVLAGALGVWGLVALLPLAFPSREPALWVAALAGAVTSGIVWPIVESYLAAGRHGPELRRAIGAFNVTWTLATALPLVFMPLFAHLHVLWTLSISAVVNTLALPFVLSLARSPGSHEHETLGESVGPEYPWLLRSASWLLPLSYLMSSTLSPILPHRLASVGALTVPASVVGATWMLTRFLTLGLMSRLLFWHGKWSALALAGGALAGGPALVLLSDTTFGIVAGLALFGVGAGLTYCLALYYSLAVGKGAVDAGGGFEALIGLGYLAGPLLGLAGRSFASDRGAATATVALTWAVAGVVAVLAFGPYRAARRRH